MDLVALQFNGRAEVELSYGLVITTDLEIGTLSMVSSILCIYFFEFPISIIQILRFKL